MVGVTIGKYHSYNDWKLYLKDTSIKFPDRKSRKVSVPGQNGELDVSKIFTNGEAKYENRAISLEFEFEDGDYTQMYRIGNVISDAIHGKEMKIILDDEPEYYYYGTCYVDLDKLNQMVSTIIITIDADPFKYDLTSSIEDWLWDPFDFETGVIRELMDLEISTANNAVEIIGGYVSVVPIFSVGRIDSPMTITVAGKSYPLKLGRNRFPQIRVGKEDVTVIFTGKGLVSIDYRGRLL